MRESKAVTQDSASSGTISNILLQVFGPDRLEHVRELGFGFIPFNTFRTSTSKTTLQSQQI